MHNDFIKKAQAFAKFVDSDIPTIIEVEGLRHFKDSFENEGFTDSSLDKWKERKTTNSRGRDLTRRKDGSLSKFGQRELGRPILTGYASGGNKLRNSLRARRINRGVVFFTYKKYAERHNEGKDGMKVRPFMRESEKLDEKILTKAERRLDQIFQ